MADFALNSPSLGGSGKASALGLAADDVELGAATVDLVSGTTVDLTYAAAHALGTCLWHTTRRSGMPIGDPTHRLGLRPRPRCG